MKHDEDIQKDKVEGQQSFADKNTEVIHDLIAHLLERRIMKGF